VVLNGLGNEILGFKVHCGLNGLGNERFLVLTSYGVKADKNYIYIYIFKRIRCRDCRERRPTLAKDKIDRSNSKSKTRYSRPKIQPTNPQSTQATLGIQTVDLRFYGVSTQFNREIKFPLTDRRYNN
jgi:hypothetical protein